MSIYAFEADAEKRRYLENHLQDEVIHSFEEPLTRPAQVPDMGQHADVLSTSVTSRVSAGVIESLPNLKLIATRSTGFEHIDVAAAAQRGIVVSNVPSYGENTVAEHTFALILALSRNICTANTRTSAGDFSMEGLRGFDLRGKTLGVVGVGHIGRFVVQMAQGFGMGVLASDPVQKPDLARRAGFTYTALEDLLRRSDIVTLHASLTPESHHLIGFHNIELFKRGALLINTARGALVDSAALVEALDRGTLAGAGLDVLEGEENLSDEQQLLGNPEASRHSLEVALRNQILLRRPDVLITPHIASDSVEAIQRILDTTIGNIRAFRRGKPTHRVGADGATHHEEDSSSSQRSCTEVAGIQS